MTNPCTRNPNQPRRAGNRRRGNEEQIITLKEINERLAPYNRRIIRRTQPGARAMYRLVKAFHAELVDWHALPGDRIIVSFTEKNAKREIIAFARGYLAMREEFDETP